MAKGKAPGDNGAAQTAEEMASLLEAQSVLFRQVAKQLRELNINEINVQSGNFFLAASMTNDFLDKQFIRKMLKKDNLAGGYVAMAECLTELAELVVRTAELKEGKGKV